MHTFTEIVDRCAAFTLETLRQTEMSIVAELQISSSTSLVKSLQMLQLQKAISAVGMFSMFEASLQDGLGCKDGFLEAKTILEREGETLLVQRLSDFRLAINVLKHGQGRSFEELVKKTIDLPFKINQQDNFFCEGDLSEVSTLIEVDDAFVRNCAHVIYEVSAVINRNL